MTTAMISPLVGGLIRTWTHDGTALWSVNDPEGLSEVIGRGLIARTPVPDSRFREAAFLNVDAGTLIVQNRYPTGTAEGSAQVEASIFQLRPANRPERAPWMELKDFLNDAAKSAVDRGDFWVAELGGWDAPKEPYCLFAVLDQGGGPVSVIEAAPAPRGTGFWPEVPENQPGSTVTAPADEGSLPAVGVFGGVAIQSWGVDPWDIALTFGKLGE
ncbi:MAG: hypothetical protein GX610_00525 [Rhodococcus sp.]|nr:hypothetical protein [Rhodococcus sp. (in: high G+C Gram-positive bacteria)]